MQRAEMKGTQMKARDLRPFVVQDPHWTPGYVTPADEPVVPTAVTLQGFEGLLNAAASTGDSAFIGVCFDLDGEPR